MSRRKRQGEQLGRVISCLALLSNAACTSTNAVKLAGPARLVTGATTPVSTETDVTPECRALLDADSAAPPAAWPSFADRPVPMSCDALGRALEPELATRMSSVLNRIRDEYLIAGCQGADAGQHHSRTISAILEMSTSLTERWSSSAQKRPAMAQRNGHLLYVAAYDTLQVLDLSRPSAPRFVGRATLDGVRTQLLVHGHRLLAIARLRADARPAFCEPGTACDFADDRGTLLSLFELQASAQPRLLEQLALSGDFSFGALVGSVAHLVTNDTASNRLGLRFEPNPPAAGAAAVRRAMGELHAANSRAIAGAAPTARLPGISRRTGSGAFAPFEPPCSAYAVTHGAEIQSILSFDLQTGSLARALLEAPFGRAELVSGELALDPPRPNPSRTNRAAYRFVLSRAPAVLAPDTPSPPFPTPVVWVAEATIPFDSSHSLALRSESTLVTVGEAVAVDSRLRVSVLGGEAPGSM
ncbi:MAG TPA: hypothetical protein VJV79_22655, partial [Polyangiaceae bacterium]|nr:hypothetical protein [Polyangiaceae bacterium]